jgi:hypothetical protein
MVDFVVSSKHTKVPQVQDVDAALKGAPEKRIPALKARIDERIRDLMAFTVIPAIGNTGAFGIRYLYVVLQITGIANTVKLACGLTRMCNEISY